MAEPLTLLVIFQLAVQVSAQNSELNDVAKQLAVEQERNAQLERRLEALESK